jgi:hypothetical protein
MGGTGPYWEDWPTLTYRLPMGAYRALLLFIAHDWANHPIGPNGARLAPVGPDLDLNKLATHESLRSPNEKCRMCEESND